jgi:hypothetical protein
MKVNTDKLLYLVSCYTNVKSVELKIVELFYMMLRFTSPVFDYIIRKKKYRLLRSPMLRHWLLMNFGNLYNFPRFLLEDDQLITINLSSIRNKHDKEIALEVMNVYNILMENMIVTIVRLLGYSLDGSLRYIKTNDRILHSDFVRPIVYSMTDKAMYMYLVEFITGDNIDFSVDEMLRCYNDEKEGKNIVIRTGQIYYDEYNNVIITGNRYLDKNRDVMESCQRILTNIHNNRSIRLEEMSPMDNYLMETMIFYDDWMNVMRIVSDGLGGVRMVKMSREEYEKLDETESLSDSGDSGDESVEGSYKSDDELDEGEASSSDIVVDRFGSMKI